MKVSLGEKIRNLREDADMTQTTLANKTNMTQRKISYIENDKYEPSIEDLREICLCFGISSDYFLDLPQNLPFPQK